MLNAHFLRSGSHLNLTRGSSKHEFFFRLCNGLKSLLCCVKKNITYPMKILFITWQKSRRTQISIRVGEKKNFFILFQLHSTHHTQQQTNKLILNFIHRASRMKRPTHTRQALESMNFILKYESRYSYLFLSFHIHPPSCFRATYECDACETQKRRKCFFLFSKSFPPPHTHPVRVDVPTKRIVKYLEHLNTLSHIIISNIIHA